MSKVNFSRNIFLEKEELVRFQDLSQNNVVEFLQRNDITSYGIVRQGANAGADFLIENGSTSGTFKMNYDSYAATDDILLMYLKLFDNYPITDDSNWYWVKIGQRYLNTEIGTVFVNTAGELSGLGTFFTEVLRSQTSKAPVKIKFYKENVQGVPQTVSNDGIYEVTSLIDNTNVILSGSFVNESDLKYIVIGSVALGSPLTPAQKEGIYSYDSCIVSLVLETTLNTPPAGAIANKEFYIARVRNVGGTVTIQDKRTDYYSTNVSGINDNLIEKINFATAAITKGLSDAGIDAVILTGCDASLGGGNVNMDAGEIYWDGEIFQVDAQVVSDPGASYIFYLQIDPTTFYLPIRKLKLYSGLTLPASSLLFAGHYYAALIESLVTLKSYLMSPENNLSELTDLVAARTTLNVWSKVQSVERHLTGTTPTHPPVTGWTLDKSKVGPTLPVGLREIHLWKYQLVENCHILRIRPLQQSWYGLGSAFTPNIVATAGDRATLYKITPHANIYDGYELILQIDCHDTAPVANKSRYFSILGQYTVVADATNYLGNLQISTQKEEVLRVVNSGLSYDNKCAEGGAASPFATRSYLKWQMINVSSNDIRTAATVAAADSYTQYCMDILYIKFKWNAARNLWEQIGLSQPYVS